MDQMDRAEYLERLELAVGRLEEVKEDQALKTPYADFFQKGAGFLLVVLRLRQELETAPGAGALAVKKTLKELEEQNLRLYGDLLPEKYETSYGNPDYAVRMLGEDFGPYFSALYAEVRGVIVYVFEDRLPDLVVTLELFLECLCAFADPELPTAQDLKSILASWHSDYCADFMKYRTRELVDPSLDFAKRLILESDLQDLRYLYAFGEYVSDNARQTAAFLAVLPQEEIDRMARTWTEGFRQGFIVMGKDLSKKKTVNIQYSLGFERIIRSAILQFEDMGLASILFRTAAHRVNCRPGKRGWFGEDPNPQYAFDHRNDDAVFLDSRLVTRKLSALHEAFEAHKTLANTHAGPAVLEVFGEKPFVPVVKETALSLTREQRELRVKYDTQSAQLTNRYIIGEERCFTIIAWPLPEIGENYPEIFRETFRINTLDNELYRQIQQKLIDVLDTGCRVRIKGMAGNETDLTVALPRLSDPSRETNFENCVADVNIPVGEVFTTPELAGTEGLLHVSLAYLEGLRYEDLRLWVKDGITCGYSCGNYPDAAQGKKYIEENILFHHDFLPMGEFAIGTNTTAYAMAERFGIADRMPILIAEKMGPHFAFGDTCYSWEEDNVTYNPDGKAIVARDNAYSILRKTDPSRAYFNCHTDVTLPYHELGSIDVERPDGSRVRILENGRFVLDGCEELNRALEAGER